MSVYESIMQGLNEAVEHQQGTKKAKTVRLSIKPIQDFDANEIKKIRLSMGMSQVMFAELLGVSHKTVEAWESGRNKPQGSSSRLLEAVRDDPTFLERFQA